MSQWNVNCLNVNQPKRQLNEWQKILHTATLKKKKMQIGYLQIFVWIRWLKVLKRLLNRREMFLSRVSLKLAINLNCTFNRMWTWEAPHHWHPQKKGKLDNFCFQMDNTFGSLVMAISSDNWHSTVYIFYIYTMVRSNRPIRLSHSGK